MKQIIIRRDAVFALHANVSLKGYPSYDIPLPSPEAAGPLLKAVRIATYAAGFSVTREGVVPSLIDRNSLEAYIRQREPDLLAPQ